MASITLRQLWIHDVADLSVYVTADIEEAPASLALGGRFASLAGGRQRLITTAARSRSVPLALSLLSAADIAQLEAWAGQLLMIRSPHGLLLFGSFLGLDTTWRNADEAEACSLTFNEITHSLEV